MGDNLKFVILAKARIYKAELKFYDIISNGFQPTLE
jgi:hypothetical protein